MDHRGKIEELGHDECLTRMATQRLGRLGVVVDGVPVVLPMRFAIDGDTVVLQTNKGAKVFHAPLNAVSFEVDHVDWAKGVGWSVLIQGIGEDISSSIDERSEALRADRPFMGTPAGGPLAQDHSSKGDGPDHSRQPPR